MKPSPKILCREFPKSLYVPEAFFQPKYSAFNANLFTVLQSVETETLHVALIVEYFHYFFRQNGGRCLQPRGGNSRTISSSSPTSFLEASAPPAALEAVAVAVVVEAAIRVSYYFFHQFLLQLSLLNLGLLGWRFLPPLPTQNLVDMIVLLVRHYCGGHLQCGPRIECGSGGAVLFLAHHDHGAGVGWDANLPSSNQRGCSKTRDRAS